MTLSRVFVRIGLIAILGLFAASLSLQPSAAAPAEPANNAATTAPAVKLSYDGSMATAVWATIVGNTLLIQSASATLSETNTDQAQMSWGTTTTISATPVVASSVPALPQLALSQDGSVAIVMWQQPTTQSQAVIQSAVATINGNTASWGSVDAVTTDASASAGVQPQIEISQDGSLATGAWQQTVNGVTSIAASSATISGTTASWGTTTTIQDSSSGTQPNLALSGDGTKAIAVWFQRASVDQPANIVAGSYGSITGNTATWSSPIDMTANLDSSKDEPSALSDQAVTLSSDASLWTVVYYAATKNGYEAQTQTGTFGTTSVKKSLSSNLLQKYENYLVKPKVVGSSDGTLVFSVWSGDNLVTSDFLGSAVGVVSSSKQDWKNDVEYYVSYSGYLSIAMPDEGGTGMATWVNGSNQVELVSAAIIGKEEPQWGTVTTLSASGQVAAAPQVAISGDGSTAITMWTSGTTNPVIQATAARVLGTGATTPWSTPVTLSNGPLTPAFAQPTPQETGFTVQVTNYDPDYAWTVSTTGGQVAISDTGLITATNIGTHSTVTVTTSHTGGPDGQAEVTGYSDEGAAAPTAASVPTSQPSAPSSICPEGCASTPKPASPSLSVSASPKPTASASASSKPPAKTSTTQQPATTSQTKVTVKAGDTLWDLAAAQLGPGASNTAIDAQWKKWYQANKSTIGSNPHAIDVNMTLTVPAKPS